MILPVTTFIAYQGDGPEDNRQAAYNRSRKDGPKHVSGKCANLTQ